MIRAPEVEVRSLALHMRAYALFAKVHPGVLDDVTDQERFVMIHGFLERLRKELEPGDLEVLQDIKYIRSKIGAAPVVRVARKVYRRIRDVRAFARDLMVVL